MKKRYSVLIIGLLMAALLMAGCGSQSAAPAKSDKESGADKEVVLKAVTAWPEKIRDNDGFKFLQKEVNERGKGKLKIQYLGGPEVIPTNELINAVKSGSVDIAWLSMIYTVSIVPEGHAYKLSKFTPDQERKNGFFDLFNEIYQKKANAVYLGRGIPGVHFNLYTSFPVNSVADLKGKPIRTTMNYKDFLVALGASPVTIDPGEVYSALERGVVQGYGWPSFGITEWGWDAKTKYVIEPGFYQVDAGALVNRDKWNSLSDDQKKILTDSAIAMEKAMEQHFKELVKSDRELLTQKGIKVIQLPPEETANFLKLADEAIMNNVLKASPEYGQKIKDVLSK